MTVIAPSQTHSYCDLGRAVIETEYQAIAALLHRLDDHFTRACEYLFDCQGRIIVTGMGKSGHIGNKIASTFASTGTPAFFVHPGEASHGDMGMITAKDVLLAISYSGENPEVTMLLPLIKRLNIPLISLTGRPYSTLANFATVNLNIQVEKEACPLGLAPTASTTATLVMGDALAIALLQKRGFTIEDFALYHPGGSLGKKLLLRVDDLLHTGQSIPAVRPSASIAETLVEITKKRLGFALVLEQDHIQGIYTDGDLRRTLDKQLDIHRTPIQEVMSISPKRILLGTLAAEALQIMGQHKITSLIVTHPDGRLAGVLHLHDLLSAGMG